MADTKISALTSATPVLTDEIVIVDDPAGVPSSKRTTLTSVRTLMDFQEKPAEGAFVDGDKTKLDGIEASADVTDTANVTAAGALMDSEVTNLAAVKAFDPTDYATAAQGTTADSALQPADSVTQLDGTANRVLYVNGTGDVTELALGADGTYLKSNGATVAPSFATPAGSGDVSKVGTPANNQFGVWTGDGTIEGISEFTFDGINITVSADIDPNADGTINLGNSTNRYASISVDSIDLNGTTLDGTTLADPGADRILFWDDSAGTTTYLTAGTGLSITGTTMTATGLADVVDDPTPQLGGNLDGQGNEVANYTNAVVTSVSGALTTAAHSGNVIKTSGNVTVPTTAGFTCTIIAGGAHTVTFNATTSAAMATGDVMTVVVESSTVIHAVLTAAADKVSFS